MVEREGGGRGVGAGRGMACSRARRKDCRKCWGRIGKDRECGYAGNRVGIYLPIYLYIRQSVYLSTYLYTYLSSVDKV